MHRRLFLFAGLALAGCQNLPDPQAKPSAPYGELEPVYSVRAGRDGITLRVGSNGCTAKTDFVFYLERVRGQPQIAFARKKLDGCRSLAQGSTEIAFSWTELGLDPRSPVFLLNPLVAWTGSGQ